MNELWQKVQDLERRVRELEARPVYVPVIQPSPAIAVAKRPRYIFCRLRSKCCPRSK